ncbi:L-threonylcarbamoyladenylate synthase [Holdemania filiformis]|uniref:L-threonylcarbamoyladenylate synthase n=1 Tax=Holdemania filiformis TaxID=61171 RepID=UPI0024302697|nr:L-threonylcarbamoyladenylate synthase [Holdemania filiformis]
METQRLTKKDSAQIIEILNRGGVVAFPTDTVYGLAVRYDLKEAILKMKEAKQRPETKPFPMMVSSKAQIERVAVTDARSQKLIDQWMPGALTLVFKKRPEIDELVTNGFPTIGIRMPDDDFVLEIINRVGVPLLVPSANLSGQPSCTTSEEVLKQLDGRIDAVVLGESGASTASTVCDTTGDELKILRQGPIKLEDLEASI